MEARAHSPETLAPTPMRVLERRMETDDTVTLTLDAGPRGFAYAPGQFVMLARFGVGEVPISISGGGGPDGTDRLLLTVRAVGAVTRAILGTAPGEWLGVRGPYGTSWPVPAPDAADLVVMAGGLGLAPLRAAIVSAIAAAPPERPVRVLVGAREPAGIPFAGEIEGWRAVAGADVRVTVDVADPGWTGEVGLVTSLLEGLRIDPDRTVACVCGPEVMMRFSARALLARGVDPGRIALSVERNMECGAALCGRCQLGPFILCRDGPVLPYAALAGPLAVEEL